MPGKLVVFDGGSPLPVSGSGFRYFIVKPRFSHVFSDLKSEKGYCLPLPQMHITLHVPFEDSMVAILGNVWPVHGYIFK